MRDKHERGGDAGAVKGPEGKEPVENGRKGEAQNDEGINGPGEKGKLIHRSNGEPVIEPADPMEEVPVIEPADPMEEVPVIELTDPMEEEPVIELTDLVEEETVPELVDGVGDASVTEPSGQMERAPEKSDARKGPDREETREMPSTEPPAQGLEIAGASITEAELRRVVEKVVRELYAEKIEDLLVTAVEKRVSREIDRLKTLLKGDGA